MNFLEGFSIVFYHIIITIEPQKILTETLILVLFINHIHHTLIKKN